MEACQSRNDQLDREVHELITKQENLKSKIGQLSKDLDNSERRAQETKTQLTNAASNQEAEFLQKVAYLKSLGEENARKWNEEKDQLTNAAEKRLQHSLQALEASKDADIFSLKERLDTLQLHLDSIIQQHEEEMVRAENDKQQALLIAHRDKQAVAERLEQIQRELKVEMENLDRLRRDAAARADRDRTLIKQHKDEIAKLKTKCDEQKIKAEEEIRRLDIQLSSVCSERDANLKEIENLKSHIRLTEDKATNLNIQLQDTLRKLKECKFLWIFFFLLLCANFLLIF